MTLSQHKPDELLPKPLRGPESASKAPRRLCLRIPEELRDQAIERLVGTGSQMDRQHAQRFLEYARDRQVSLDGLWASLDRSGGIEFTVLAVPNPGRTAMVFATHPKSREQTAAIGELLDFACGELAGFGVDLAQVLLDPSDSLEHEAFTAGGFFTLASLSYLERSTKTSKFDHAQSLAWPAGVKPIRYVESLRNELVQVLDATYEQTLDCPGLRGYRRTADILEGHRSTGLFDPALWTLLSIEGRLGGALLLNPSVDRHSIELVYLGLAKWARARGLARLLLRYGFSLLHRRSERIVTLAVDEANAPALSLYRSEGFVPVLRRSAMIRSIRAPGA